MTSPVAPMPNETPEQRQARLDAAYRAHAELMARQRAAERAQMMETMRSLPTPEPMPMGTPIAQQPQGLTLSNVPRTLTLSNVPQQPQGGLTLGSPLSPQQQPEIVVKPQYDMPVMPTPMPPMQQPQGVGGGMPMQPQGVSYGAGVGGGMPMQPQSIANAMQQPNVIDNRIGPNFGKPMQPEGLQGIAGILGRFLDKGIGNDPMQPGFIGKHFTGDAPKPGMKYIETGEGLVPVPINDKPMQPPAGMGLGSSVGASSGGMGLGSAIGAFFGGMQPEIVVKPQYDMPVMPTPMPPMQQPQGLSLSNVPRTLSLSNVPQQAAPQPAPTGMALGGLMRKYY